jgi:protein phosphatase
MGGHIGGEVASRLAVSTIREYILSNPGKLTDTNQIINDSLIAANEALHKKTSETPGLRGMGTTCVILILNSGIAHYGCVGDSRIYLIREHKIYQITRDQSFVQTLIDQGLISYKDAESHPRKNEIMQALGIQSNIKPAIKENGLKIYKEDKFILCSDGLSGMMNDEDILEITDKFPPENSCERLIALANKNGGDDNITVQVIGILNGSSLPPELKGTAPEGTVDKSIKKKKAEREITKERTKEIRYSPIPIVEPKKKSHLFYYITGLLLMVLIIFAMWYFLIRKDTKPSEEIKTNENKNTNEEIIKPKEGDEIKKAPPADKTDEKQTKKTKEPRGNKEDKKEEKKIEKEVKKTEQEVKEEINKTKKKVEEEIKDINK